MTRSILPPLKSNIFVTGLSQATCYPVRNMFRRGRRWVFSKIFGGIEDREDHLLYKVFTLLWESLVPFVEVPKRF